MHTKVLIKLEQIARFRVAGNVSDGRICTVLGLTRGGLSRILSLPEYKETEEAVRLGTVTAMDEALAGKADEIRKVYAVGVPLAMKALLETVQQRQDLRARLDAAKEFLDRDPLRTFSKSRIETGVPAQPSLPAAMVAGIVAESDEVSKEINTATPAESISGAIAGNATSVILPEGGLVQ